MLPNPWAAVCRSWLGDSIGILPDLQHRDGAR